MRIFFILLVACAPLSLCAMNTPQGQSPVPVAPPPPAPPSSEGSSNPRSYLEDPQVMLMLMGGGI